ncbi:hypothetical protein D1AOALGA4SA_3643 [Olavius algarvensis Delta 1 endosymbiont]|nr:hypothetical protein D1AOALGA4SA_3643 [Olavius algarvensis Delta 1 endosymbiont]
MTETNKFIDSRSDRCFEFVFLVIVIYLIFVICYLGFTIRHSFWDNI